MSKPKKLPRTLYRPRVVAILTLPKNVANTTFGSKPADPSIRLVPNEEVETIDLPIRVRNLHLTLNDHNHADMCTIEAEYLDIGLDPRILTSAIVRVFIGEFDDSPPKKSDCKFVGIMTKPSRSGSDQGLTMTLEFLDYTTLFLEHRHYDPLEVPTLDMTLGEAWAQICDHVGPTSDAGEFTPVTSILRNRIVFIDETSIETGEISESLSTVRLGAGTTERYRSLGRVPLKSPDMDAWAVWQTCCNMLGLITYIKNDTCVVTTARDLYTSKNPPAFVWGRNIESIREERNSNIVKKGIGIRSYNALTNTTLEALYPDDGDKRILKKQLAVKTKNGLSKPAKVVQDRIFFNFPSVTDPTKLKDLAQRVWEEYSRQELEGTLTTWDLDLLGVGSKVEGKIFNILDLGPGDTIWIGFDPESKTILPSLGSPSKQVQYLLDGGYSEEAAEYLVANLQNMTRWVPTFFVKKIELELTSDESGGNLKISINYLNKINESGSTY